MRRKYPPEARRCACGNPKHPRAAQCRTCWLADRPPVPLSYTCAECGGHKAKGNARCAACRAAAAYTDPDRPFPMGPDETELYGAITTLENADEKVLVIHKVGPARKAVRAAYAEATALDPTFRIVSISTPQTIYTDLQGARADPHGTFAGPAALPELQYGEMVHPRLRLGKFVA